MMNQQTFFQDAVSPIMNVLDKFHDDAMTSVIFIMMYVSFMMISLMLSPSSTNTPYEDHELETVWTFLPALVLITLALPSLRLLYLLDEVSSPSLTLKTIGHQWYWSYDYSDFNSVEFDSYMIQTEDLSTGELRLLETDNHVILPWGSETRLLVTAADVLHAWTIPSLGVKVDAIPGRLNQLTLSPIQPGIFYGQCSEICGANHSFMPITIELITPDDWIQWISSLLEL